MVSFQTRIHRETLDYDGLALSPHWIYRQFDLMGNALVAFVGEAKVSTDHMVDLEDVKKNAPIYSPKMLHFIGEWFQGTFEEALLMQMLFIQNVYSELAQCHAADLRRRGNDIYFKDRKVSVSIVTKSLTSFLMHTGVNVETENTPIPAAGLKELNLDPFGFATRVISTFQADLTSCGKSRVKVLPR